MRSAAARRAGYAPTRVSRQSTGGGWAPLAGWGVHGELAALASSSRLKPPDRHRPRHGGRRPPPLPPDSGLPTRGRAPRPSYARCCITMAELRWPRVGHNNSSAACVNRQHVLLSYKEACNDHNRATRCDPVPRGCGCPGISPARGAILQSARGQMQMQVTEARLGTKLTRNCGQSAQRRRPRVSSSATWHAAVASCVLRLLLCRSLEPRRHVVLPRALPVRIACTPPSSTWGIFAFAPHITNHTPAKKSPTSSGDTPWCSICIAISERATPTARIRR